MGVKKQELISTGTITELSPDTLFVVNEYLNNNLDIAATAKSLSLSESVVMEIVESKPCDNYISRQLASASLEVSDNITKTLSLLINKKLEEAMETGEYSTKDIVDIIKVLSDHQNKVDNARTKARDSSTKIVTQNNLNVEPSGLEALFDSLKKPSVIVEHKDEEKS